MSEMMKAAVLYGNKDIRYDDFPMPVLREGTVKIKVAACGICGSDIPRVLNNGAHYYPTVLGHEFSGIVEEVASDVTGFSVGDHVVGAPLVPCHTCEDCKKGNYALCKKYSFVGSREQGAMAEYVVIPAINVVKIDPSIPLDLAALFEPSSVAVHGINITDFQPGGTVAILGCGTIGLLTMQWAKILGASKVVAFARSARPLELALQLGADAVVNTSDPDFMEQAKALTNGRGFDYVYETAGSVQTMYQSFELAGNKAHLCFIGTPKQDLVFSPKLWELMNRKEFYLTGSWMSYSAPFPGKEWTMTAEALKDGRLKFDPALFHAKFSMKDVDKAFALYETPGVVKGRILLVNEGV